MLNLFLLFLTLLFSVPCPWASWVSQFWETSVPLCLCLQSSFLLGDGWGPILLPESPVWRRRSGGVDDVFAMILPRSRGCWWLWSYLSTPPSGLPWQSPLAGLKLTLLHWGPPPTQWALLPLYLPGPAVRIWKLGIYRSEFSPATRSPRKKFADRICQMWGADRIWQYIVCMANYMTIFCVFEGIDIISCWNRCVSGGFAMETMLFEHKFCRLFFP